MDDHLKQEICHSNEDIVSNATLLSVDTRTLLDHSTHSSPNNDNSKKKHSSRRSLINNLEDTSSPISIIQSKKIPIKRTSSSHSTATSSIPIQSTSYIKETAISRSLMNDSNQSTTNIQKEREWSKLLKEAYSEPIQTYSTTPTQSSFTKLSPKTTSIKESIVSSGSMPAFNRYYTKPLDNLPKPTLKLNLLAETKTRIFNLRFQRLDSTANQSVFTGGLKLHHPKTGSTISYTRSSTKFSSQNTKYSFGTVKSESMFRVLSNALQLYLQLNVLSNTDKIIAWRGCGLVKMLDEYVKEVNGKMGVIVNSRFKSIGEIRDASVEEESVYLLISKKMLTLMKVNRSIRTTVDLQCLEVVYSISVDSIQSIVFGPRDLYATIHFKHQVLDTIKVMAIVLLFRVPIVYQELLEFIELNQLESRISRDQSKYTSQIKESILLKKGKKLIMINHANYNIDTLPWLKKIVKKTWYQQLFTIEEVKVEKVDGGIIGVDDFDSLGQLPILSPFDCFQMYQLVGLLLNNQGKQDVNVKTCSLLSTGEYIYLFIERLDVQRNNNSGAEVDDSEAKGLLSDIIPVVDGDSLIRVARIKDIIKLEKWKSWRWTNGKVDQMNQSVSKPAQNIYYGQIGYENGDRSDGWFWWLRISFKNGYGDPMDILYVDESGEEILVFFEWLRRFCGDDVECIDGDD